MNNLVKAQSDFDLEKEHAKTSVGEFYKEGKNKVEKAQDTLQDYSDELINQLNDKPVSTLLIAGAIGYLLSALFRKYKKI